MKKKVRPLLMSVDDDPAYNKILSSICEKMQVEVNISDTAKEFVKKLSTTTPDICLIDINLSRGEKVGLQIVKFIKEKMNKKIPILVVSASNDMETLNSVAEIGADGFMAKPIDAPRLLSKLAKYLPYEKISNLETFFKTIPSSYSQCIVDRDATILGMNDEGIFLECSDEIPIGVEIELEGNIFQDILGDMSPSIKVTSAINLIEDPILKSKSYLVFDQKNILLQDSIAKWLHQIDLNEK